MIVYEITKEYAPAFAYYVPKFILRKIGKPGYHSLGEVVLAGEEHYSAGFLQFYDGSAKKSHEAVLTYLYIPKEERGEANAWSLFMEMERKLKALGVKKLTVNLNHLIVDELQPFLVKMGFRESTDKPALITAPVSELTTEKLLSLPDSDAVVPLGQVSKTEVARVMQALGTKKLQAMGIDSDIHADDYSSRLSMMYHAGDSDGLLLVANRPDGGFSLKLCRCAGRNVQKGMLTMLSAAAKVIKQRQLDDAICYITCYNENTLTAIRAINSDADLKPVWQGEKRYE